MAITYNDLYLDVRRQLRESGVESSTLEARELVCFGTGKSREELQRDGGLYASPELERQVRSLVDRRLAGEPVALRLGHLWYYLLWDVIRVLLWPNFLLSVCMREFREDLEDICDQAAMQEGGMDAYEYGKLLIGSIKILQEETPGGTAAFAGEKEYREVRQRILRIMEYAPYEKRRVRILCVCALAVLAGIFLMIYGNSFPRYVKLMDMVVTNDAEEYWVLKDSGMLRKAVSADEEKVYIDRAAMDVVLREYGIEDSQFTLLFGGYEKLPGFGGNGNLVYVDYSGQEERLEIPYEDSDVYITARILKMI